MTISRLERRGSLIVCPDGSGDFTNIQAAIEEARDGEVIELCDGIYRGTGNRDIDFQNKAIVVRSRSGNPERCIIDCAAGPGNEHRGFRFQRGENSAARLEGVSIIRGQQWDGGCDRLHRHSQLADDQELHHLGQLLLR